MATLAAAPLRVTARRALFALRGFQDTDTRTVFDALTDGRFLMLAQLSSDERRRPRLLVRTNWLESLRRQQAEAK